MRNDLSHSQLVLSTMRPKTHQPTEGILCPEPGGETKSQLVSPTLQAANRSFEGLKQRPEVNRRRRLLCSGEGEKKTWKLQDVWLATAPAISESRDWSPVG